jgi:hypothetical protein
MTQGQNKSADIAPDAARKALLDKLRDVTSVFYELELRISDFGARSSNDNFFDRMQVSANQLWLTFQR